MATPVVTTVFLVPFVFYLLFLQARVVAIRAMTTTNLGDRLFKNRKEGRDPMDPVDPDPLYLATRCHQNYVENIPMVLFVAFAVETAGADPKILSYILGGLFAMRVAHVEIGLRGKDSNGVARPMSFMVTQITMAGLASWGAWLVKDKFKMKLNI